MKRTEPFELFQPNSLREASTIVRDKGPGGRFLAGGTDLVIAMKEKGLVPKYVVDLKKIPKLSGIREQTDGSIVIGALTTMREVETFPMITKRFPFLARSAAEVGSIQIRNRATVGGNMANATPSADVAPALLVLDAKAVISGAEGERTVELENFFRGPGQTIMAADEILTAIVIPPTDPRLVGEYIKFSPREMMDLAYVGVAVALVLGENKRCEHVRISLGAVSPTPMRAGRAEAVLLNQVLTENLADKAAAEAAGESKPISDVRSSAGYRREMVRAMTKRALLNAASGKPPATWAQRREKRY
ncbi:MAG: FAD binding domain-containing protein [Candidatus Binatia bacterium]